MLKLLQLKDPEGQLLKKQNTKQEKSTLDILNNIYERENSNLQQKIKKMRDLYLQGKSPYHKQSIAEYTIEILEERVN